MKLGSTIFLTYGELPHFAAQDYEGFLRRHDNPFFNSIAGIGRYENWKLVRPYPKSLGFDFFDLIHLDGTRALEEVWFDADLTVFRRNWVAQWGYNGVPSPVNGQGYVLDGPHLPSLGAARAYLGFSDAPTGDLNWSVTATMPKHYAFPADTPLISWIRPMPQHLPLPSPMVTLSAGPAPQRYEAVRIAPAARC